METSDREMIRQLLDYIRKLEQLADGLQQENEKLRRDLDTHTSG